MMDCTDVKSKFYAEFRRFALKFSEVGTYKCFKALLEKLHRLENVPICISYHDPRDGDLLPINNDDNYARAVSTAKPLLRIIIQRQGEVNDHNDVYKKNMISTIFGAHGRLKSHPKISDPSDFRQVSAIIDVDVVPEFCRRVRLLKNSITDRPLGFFIKDGVSMRVTPTGFEKVPGIFISRVKPGGLAEISGLLSVNDEVLEVNGIEVAGRTLDQVRDMMVANSQNLIITVKPVNQRNTLPKRPRRGSLSRSSQQSTESVKSTVNHMQKDEVIFL